MSGRCHRVIVIVMIGQILPCAPLYICAEKHTLHHILSYCGCHVHKLIYYTFFFFFYLYKNCRCNIYLCNIISDLTCNAWMKNEKRDVGRKGIKGKMLLLTNINIDKRKERWKGSVKETIFTKETKREEGKNVSIKYPKH